MKDRITMDAGALVKDMESAVSGHDRRRFSGASVGAAIGSDGATNLLATALRTAGKVCWGVAVPTIVSVESFGRYSVAMSAVSTAVQAGLMGTPQVILRNTEARLPLLGLWVQALVVAIPVAVVVLWMSGLGTPLAVAAGITAVVMFVGQLTVSARLKSLRLYRAVMGSEATGALVLIGATGAMALWPAARGSFATLVAVDIICSALMVALAVVLGRQALAKDVGVAGAASHLPRIYSVGAVVLLETLFWRSQVLFLNASAAGAEGAAVFALALQLTQILFLGALAVTETWWPMIAREHRSDRVAAAVLIRQRARQYAFGFAAVALMLVAALPILIAGPLHQYRAWSLPLAVFTAARLLSGFCGFFSGVLYATSNERSMYLPTLTGVLISLVGGATLTRTSGLRGAMVVFVSAQIAVALLTYRAYRSSIVGSIASGPV